MTTSSKEIAASVPAAEKKPRAARKAKAVRPKVDPVQNGTTVKTEVSDEAFLEAFRAYLQEVFRQKGQKLETEQQLAKRFGVTRYRIRKALQEFDRSGMLKRVKRAGSLVTDFDPVNLAGDLHYRLTAGCGADEFTDARLWFLEASAEQWVERVTPTTLTQLQEVVDGVARAANEREASDKLRDFWTKLVATSGNRIVESVAGALFVPPELPAGTDAALVAERLAKIVNALRKRDDGKLKKAVSRFFRDTGGEMPAEEAATEE